MRSLTLLGTVLTALVIGTLAGCSEAPRKAPDVTASIRHSLDQANLKDVSVKQDRDKGVVTLGGKVASETDKAQADTIAKSFAGPQVVANEVAVLPPGAESDAKTVHSDLDKGIENNLHAALVQHQLEDNVKFDVNNGVVKLTGDVNSQALRGQVAQIAAAVPNVRQVVNEVQVKNQRATSSN